MPTYTYASEAVYNCRNGGRRCTIVHVFTERERDREREGERERERDRQRDRQTENFVDIGQQLQPS